MDYQSKIESQFFNVINKIFPDVFPNRILVAVSGGIDSLALTILLQKLSKVKKFELFSVTVNHGIRAESLAESTSVNTFLKGQLINHVTIDASFVPRKNIESLARKIRYDILLNFCYQNKIDNLFIAHHKQDIAENFLIRLFRGSGLDGLSSLSHRSNFRNINLIRPLIDFEKRELKQYLLDQNVQWFEDKTNKENIFLRNKIRNFLETFENKEAIYSRIAKTSKILLDKRNIEESNLLSDIHEILYFSQLGYITFNLKKFAKLDKTISIKLLGLILMEVGGTIYLPRRFKIENLYSWVINDELHKKRTLNKCVIEKFSEEKLIIYREFLGILEQKIDKEFIVWDERFFIEIIEKKILTQNLVISNLLPLEIKELKIDHSNKFLKKILLTIPIVRKSNRDVLHIPFFYKKGNDILKIDFFGRTLLRKLVDKNIKI